MALTNAAVAQERAALAAKGQSVAKAAGKVADYRKSVEDLAQDLEARQDFMDGLYKTHFGVDEGNAAGADLVSDGEAVKAGVADKKAARLSTKISMAPEAAPLVRIADRQRRFALLLTHAVERRADKAAAAIRSFGLNPDALARSAAPINPKV